MVWAHGWMSLSWPLLWSLFCRQRGIKGQIYCRSPLSSCFLLLPCLTSLRRAGFWTWLNRCLRQVILFPIIVLSNSRADWKVILCTWGATLSCAYSITSWHCLTAMPSSAFFRFRHLQILNSGSETEKPQHHKYSLQPGIMVYPCNSSTPLFACFVFLFLFLETRFHTM